MRRILTLILSTMMILSLVSCSGINNTGNNENQVTSSKTEQTKLKQSTDVNLSTDESVSKKANTSGSNILVVYFSRVGSSTFSKDVDVISSASLNVGNSELIGNTEIIADKIRETVGGDLFQIITVAPYPEDYDDTTEVALQEQQEGARPSLAKHVKNMDDYDVIFLGYPNWWGTIPMPVFTFLEEYDFSGKTIIPFCTHEGSSMGRSESDIAKLCPDSTLMEGLPIRGSRVATDSARESVKEWLQKLGIKQ